MTNRAAPAALLTLTTPLPCWHESRHSARTDLVVSLSVSAAFIQTDRPLPPGTPVYLDLDTDNGGAAIDAVATSGSSGTDAVGFAVEFVTVDERALDFIEARLGRPRFPAIRAEGLPRSDTPTVPAGLQPARLARIEDIDDPRPDDDVDPWSPIAVEAPAPAVAPPRFATPQPAIAAVAVVNAEPVAPPAAAQVDDVAPDAGAPDGDLPWEAVSSPSLGDRTRTDELFVTGPGERRPTLPPRTTTPSQTPRTRTAPLGLPAFGAPDAVVSDAFSADLDAVLSDVQPTPAFSTAPDGDDQSVLPALSTLSEEPAEEPRAAVVDVQALVDPLPGPAPEATAEPAAVVPEALAVIATTTTAASAPAAAPVLPAPPTTPAPPTLELIAAPTPELIAVTPAPPTLELVAAVVPDPPVQPWSRSLSTNLPMDETSDVENTQRWPTARVRSDAIPGAAIALPASASAAPAFAPPPTTQVFADAPSAAVEGAALPARSLPSRDETAPWPVARVRTAELGSRIPSGSSSTSPPALPSLAPSPTPAPRLGMAGLMSESTAPWPAARLRSADPAPAPVVAPVEAPALPVVAAAPAVAAPIVVAAAPAAAEASFDTPMSAGFEITFDEAFSKRSDDVVAAPTQPAGPPLARPFESSALPMTPGAGSTSTPSSAPLPDLDDAIEIEFTGPRAAVSANLFAAITEIPADAIVLPAPVAPVAAAPVVRPLPAPDDDEEGDADDADVGLVDVDFSEFKEVIGVRVTFRSEGPPPAPLPPGPTPLGTRMPTPTPTSTTNDAGRLPVQAPARPPPLVRASVLHENPVQLAMAMSPPLGGGASGQSSNPFAGESQPPMQAATVPPMFSTHEPDKWEVGPRLATPSSSLPAPRLLDAGFNSMLTNSGANSPAPQPLPLRAAPMTPAPVAVPAAAPVLARPPASPRPTPPVAAVPAPALPRAPDDLPPAATAIDHDDLDDLPVIVGGGGDEDDLPVVTGAVTGVPALAATDEPWNFGPPTSPGRPRKG